MAMDPMMMAPPGIPPGPMPDLGQGGAGGAPLGAAPPPMGGGMQAPPPPEPDWSRLDDQSLVREIKLSDAEEARVKKVLRAEIERSVRGLKERQEKLRKWRKQYREDRSDQEAKRAFRGASNVSVPISAPKLDQITSRVLIVMDSTDPLFVAEPGEDQNVPLDELSEVQSYMKAKTTDPRMKFRQRRREFVHEGGLTGTAIAKCYWDKQTRTVCRYKFAPSGEFSLDGAPTTIPSVEESVEAVYEGNVFQPIRLEDFFYPPEASNDPDLIQSAQWVAHRFPERLGEIKRKASLGIYDKKAAKLLEDIDDRNSASEVSSFYDAVLAGDAEVDEVAGDKSGNQLTNFEVYIRLNLDDKDEGKGERECVFVYNYDGDQILSARYLFFFHGKRPFVRAPYWETGEFLGRGVMERLQHVQIMANDIANMGIDAGKYANIPVLVKPKGVAIGKGKNDQIEPGKVFEVGPNEKIEKLDLGDTALSTFNWLQLVDTFGQAAAGLPDSFIGQEPTEGNRQTAAGVGQTQGAASAFFDVVLDNFRGALEEAAEMFFSNCWQFRPDGDNYNAPGDDGTPTPAVFKMPPDASSRYRFRILASSTAANPEVRKQTVQHLMGVITPTEKELMEIAQNICNPQTPPLIRDLLVDAAVRKTKALKMIVETFGLPGGVKLVPEFESIMQQHQQEIQQSIQAAQQQPKPIDATIYRHSGPKWTEMYAVNKAEMLQGAGMSVPPQLQAEIQAGTPPAGGMNAPSPSGEGMGPDGAGGAPEGAPGADGMPGLPAPDDGGPQ